MRGPGTHIMSGALASFNGVTALPGVNITQNGTALLENFTNSGTFTNNGVLTWDGGYNTTAGRLNISLIVNTSAFENDGVINIDSGGLLAHSGNDLVSGGGSRITINTGGAILLNGADLNLQGALAVNNGTIVGTTNVYYGSLAKGVGSYGTVNVFDGGTFSPGSSVGQLSVAAASFNAGGSYVFEIHDAVGMPGIGFDFTNIAAALNLAVGNTANSQFTINVVSVNASNQPGTAVNFNPTVPYSFVLASAAGGITGFSADMFRVDVHSFLNNLAGGTFNVSQSGNDLLLNFVPTLPGDFNHDGTVDAADYVVWRKTDGTQAGYDTWRANFGATAGSGSLSNATVPEPASALLLILGVAVGAWRGRRLASRVPSTR